MFVEIDSSFRNVSSRHGLNFHNTNSGHLGCFRRFCRSYPFSPSKSAKLSEQRTPKQKILVFRSTSSHNNNDDETSVCHLCTPQHNNKNLHTFPTHHSSCFSTTATKIHCSNFLRRTKKLLPYIHHSPTEQQHNNQQQQQQFFINNNQ